MESALIEGEDYYFLDGLMVFTEKFHLKRGACCGNRCKHCPYGTFNSDTEKDDKSIQ